MDFTSFAAERLPVMLRYATVLTCDPHLAEDIVQDVLIKMQRAWPRIGHADRPDAYVRRMITNEYLSWRRRKASTVVPLSPDVLAEVVPSLADQAHQFDERDAMIGKISKLPRKQRVALALRYYCGYSDPEIAEVMDCAIGTVRSHVSRGLATLRVQPGLAALKEVR
ncbi:RNA polymerase sigma-70 factor (sigma-E family) [Herbihabitans rhizosphaerae]|uniref:RNA polymerase sigma-70 factor (Sigma-E family) n=1 Tax=Herbihabitans rhizosphaerae TaxID=1872711 RepID=A0A4Q7KFS7_9PSEU|nr:SigE family RNA polymerase sigma factor [Herbihabitans rhizosphaerae]RZS31421.1 RNA polymerase sigma-70 factor (sigma-E family) [Herbihabitans rhizosphaerae]